MNVETKSTERMENVSGENVSNIKSYDYLTKFFRRRSVIALCSGILTLVLAFNGIVAGVIRTIEVINANGFLSFIYYTMIANTLAMCSIAFIIPFAVDGIKKRRFVLPKWVAMLHYLAATSISIMMVFVLAFMSWASPENAFGGSNLIMHIFCPILILISFFQIENRYIYSLKDRFIGCIPFYIYLIVYFVEVIIVGEENGGWPDIYQIHEHMLPALAIPILMALGLAVSWLIASISNFLTKKREEKMFENWKKDIDPIEAKIEAYGLGNMMSQINNKNSTVIPLDILGYIAKKANMDVNELIMPYVKGLINEKQEKNSLLL